MLTYGIARAWRPELLREVVSHVAELAHRASDAWWASAKVSTDVAGSWTDDVGHMATAKIDSWSSAVLDLADRLDATAAELDAAVDQLIAAKHKLDAVVTAAEQDNYTVSSEGLVVGPPLKLGNPNMPTNPSANWHNGNAEQYQHPLDLALLDMNAAEEAFAGQLAALGQASQTVSVMGGSVGDVVPSVPPHMSSKQAAHWWSHLSGGQRTALLSFGLPALYGIKGLPAVVTDKVNRARLDEEYEYDKTMLAEARRTLPGNDPRIGYWKRAVQVCVTTRTNLASFEPGGVHAAGLPPTQQHAYLMHFSSTFHQGGGSVTLAIGNPDTALNVSGFVEGVGSRPTQTVFANNGLNILRAEDDLFQDGAHDSMVLYQIGPAPKGLGLGVIQGYADDYEAVMRGQNNANYDSHEAVPGSQGNYTLFGHSYGTEELTLALTHDGGAPRTHTLVMLASPGVAADSPHDYIGIDPDNIWSARSSDDPIQFPANNDPITVLGQIVSASEGSPTHDLTDPMDFTQTFPVEPSSILHGHSSYFEVPHDLLKLARLAEGQTPR